MRAKAHPDSSLADLYDPLAMPADLAKAHAKLDRAVDRCYRSQPFANERNRVEYLFKLYEQLTAPLLPAPRPRASGRRRWTDGGAHPPLLTSTMLRPEFPAQRAAGESWVR